MGGGTKITRYLPNNEYKAAIGANSPSSSNVFATIADLPAGGDGIYDGSGSLTSPTIVTLSGANILSFDDGIFNGTNGANLGFSFNSGTSVIHSDIVELGSKSKTYNSLIKLYGNTYVQLFFDTTHATKPNIYSQGGNLQFTANSIGFGTGPLEKFHVAGGNMKFEGLTDVNLFFLDHSADNVIIGAATGASKLTIATGDVETVVAGKGLIVLDDTNGLRYRIYMSNGVLSSQLA